MDGTSTAEDLTGTAREVLGQAGARTAAAWSVLRTGEPGLARDRRWPWMLTAALAGAAAGAAVAWAARRVRASDAPEAQDPEQLRAVVDRPTT